MKIFDAHYHVSPSEQEYTIVAAGRNIIFNSVDSFRAYSKPFQAADSCTVLFDFKNQDRDQQEIVEEKIDAWKIHSRIQQIQSSEYSLVIEKLEEIRFKVPLIVDAFYYGSDLEFQPDLQGIIRLAKRFPEVPVIIAHSGGYQVLRYFYHLKTLDNIYFDLSFSLSYLKDTSAFLDFRNLVKSGDENKILFGTDFPFTDAAGQLNTLMEIFRDLNTPDIAVNKILYQNAAGIFNVK
jgi:predicted TIM-barrel fold metal-dependent hydrolase